MFRTLYAPTPFETPFSLLVTLAMTTSDEKVRKAATRALQGGPQLLQTCPCRLSRFCDLTDYFYGTPKEVLRERTLYPLYLGCMSDSMADQMEAQVCDGILGRSCGPVLPLPLLAANRYGLDCPECSEHSKLLSGRRCSLAFHCTPLQTRCPIHGHQYRLADPCSSEEARMIISDDAGRKRNSVRLSETLYRFLNTRSSRSQMDEIEACLRRRKYMCENGRVKRTNLTHDFIARYSGGFEDIRLSAWVSNDRMIAHIIHCLANPGVAAHPVEIALLQIALMDIEYTRPIASKNPGNFSKTRTRTIAPKRKTQKLSGIKTGDQKNL